MAETSWFSIRPVALADERLETLRRDAAAADDSR